MIKNITNLFFLMGVTGFQGVERKPNESIQQIEKQNIMKQQAQDIYTKGFESYSKYLDSFSKPSLLFQYYSSPNLAYSNVLTNSIVEIIDLSKDYTVQNLQSILENLYECDRNIIESNPKEEKTIDINGRFIKPSRLFKYIIGFYLPKILSLKKKDEDERFLLALNNITYQIMTKGTLTESFKADIYITKKSITDLDFQVEFNNKELEEFINKELE
jgi:hypothetical protein